MTIGGDDVKGLVKGQVAYIRSELLFAPRVGENEIGVDHCDVLWDKK